MALRVDAAPVRKILKLEWGYELLAYYYEKGEHTCGYQRFAFTQNKEKAEQFQKMEPMWDDKGSRENKIEKIPVYVDEYGKLYEITFKSIEDCENEFNKFDPWYKTFH